MNTVVLFGITGGYIAEEIKRILAHYGMVAICGTRIENSFDSPYFLVVEYSTRVNIARGNGVVVLIGEIGDNCIFDIPNSYKGVVFSGDKKGLQLLQKRGITTLSCGMSQSDTLILSSISENTASICLQRKIITITGDVIEPREFPIKLKNKISDYALLAAIGILLLYGIEPKDIWY